MVVEGRRGLWRVGEDGGVGGESGGGEERVVKGGEDGRGKERVLEGRRGW